MSQRERIMVLVLGVLLLGGLAFAAHTLLVQPILDKQKEVSALTTDIASRNSDLQLVQERNKRLKEYVRRSLPVNAEIAKLEYEEVLLKLLRESNAPKGYVGISFDPSKSNSPVGIPQLIPDSKTDKTLAYKLVVFKIEMKHADLACVTEFLKRYYQLNLLHQITFFEMKRDGNVDLSPDPRNQYERGDLTVNITTEGIILNGAEDRKSLLPVPLGFAGAMGGLGLTGMEQTPSTGRYIVPRQFEQLLAATNPPRDYYQVVAKDPFHGTLPTPKPEPEKKPWVEPPPPPKPDYSEGIFYSTKLTTYEGGEQAVEIYVRDRFNNEDYVITLSQSGERVKARVNKYEYHLHKVNASEQKKKVYSQDTLEISKYTMSTKHDFKVYGLDGDALILGEKPLGPPAPKADTGTRGPRGGPTAPVKTPLPPPDPRAALIGGLVVPSTPQAEKIYRWENGQPLSKLVELTGKEADKAVRRAQSSLMPDPAANGASAVNPITVTEK